MLAGAKIFNLKAMLLWRNPVLKKKSQVIYNRVEVRESTILLRLASFQTQFYDNPWLAREEIRMKKRRWP